MVALAAHQIRTASKAQDALWQASRVQPACRARRGRGAKVDFERLEPRTLLAATLYVTAPGGPTDATHFSTLQAALVVAAAGDTLYLQPGFATGTFNSATLIGSTAVGDTSIRVNNPLAVGQVVTIGTTSFADPMERALVKTVTPTLLGDFLVTLATPLQFAHTNSPVNGTNSSTTGPTIGIATGLTLAADPAASGPVVLPFNLELWAGAASVTLQRLALTAGSATSLYINNNGNTLANVTVGNQLVLANSDGNTLSQVRVNGRLAVETGSTENVVSDSTLASVQLRTGTNHNSFVRNAIGTLRAFGVGSSNGDDLFEQNTFTGAVLIAGNSSGATNSRLLNNTFTLAAGKPLVLENASGTRVEGNTLVTAGNFATAITVHNSDDVLILNNQITTTGTGGGGIFAYADGTASTSLDIRGNTVQTTNGIAISFGKNDTTANVEARIEGNDLRNNGSGVVVWGDGESGGAIDAGGGSTRFGTSLGNNDFTGFATSDDTRYAIGLFYTSASHTLHADNNLWSVADPLAIVADGTHTPAAGGSGIITATLPTPPTPEPVEVLDATAADLAAVQTGTTTGIVAHFNSTLARVAADFVVTITWGDGSSTPGLVVANPAGGFDVLASHQWNSEGTFIFTVAITSSGGAAIEVDGAATIAPRFLTVQGKSFTVDKKQTFSGVVATFTDNLGGTLAHQYVASVAWSDGVTTTATVQKNADGSFSILTSRTFSMAGVMVASVSVGTSDGLFFGTASLTATITNSNDKLPGNNKKKLAKLAVVVKKCIAESHRHHKAAHAISAHKPAFACRR